MKPFLTYGIERYGDAALVRIVKITEGAGGLFNRQELECYETASRGATASAKRSMKKLEQQGALS